MFYVSEVWFFWWQLRVTPMMFSNKDHAKMSTDLVLEDVHWLLRPFCRVEWVTQKDMGEG